MKNGQKMINVEKYDVLTNEDKKGATSGYETFSEN
jgi:hypothetical protein